MCALGERKESCTSTTAPPGSPSRLTERSAIRASYRCVFAMTTYWYLTMPSEMGTLISPSQRSPSLRVSFGAAQDQCVSCLLLECVILLECVLLACSRASHISRHARTGARAPRVRARQVRGDGQCRGAGRMGAHTARTRFARTEFRARAVERPGPLKAPTALDFGVGQYLC
jgi:hypothetical protein